MLSVEPESRLADGVDERLLFFFFVVVVGEVGEVGEVGWVAAVVVVIAVDCVVVVMTVGGTDLVDTFTLLVFFFKGVFDEQEEEGDAVVSDPIICFTGYKYT